jgi:DNA-binding CsgD family transcriptional regulator
VLYPDNGVAVPFQDRPQAVRFADRLMEFINDIHRRKAEIVPKHRVFKKTSVVEILRLLPKNNCRECGCATCVAFAALLSRQEIVPTKCPYMVPAIAEQAVYPIYDDNGNLVSKVVIEINTSMNSDPERMNNGRTGPTPTPAKSVRRDDPKRNEANLSLPQPLSRREIEVLGMVARGDTNVDIAKALSISSHTVKSHIIHIFNKLGVNDRTQAAIWAVKHNIVPFQ